MKLRLLSEKLPSRERLRSFGRLHFSRNAERTVLFILTLAMLVMGLLYKAGIW